MILGLILTTWWYVAPCYETDPYSFRDQNISDSREVLNREVNRALDDIARNWSGKRDHYRVAAAVYWKLGGIYWVDKLERWAMNSPEVEKLPTTRYRSIYRGMPFWVTRAAFVFGVGDSIKINGTLIGTDKIGHFFPKDVSSLSGTCAMGLKHVPPSDLLPPNGEFSVERQPVAIQTRTWSPIMKATVSIGPYWKTILSRVNRPFCAGKVIVWSCNGPLIGQTTSMPFGTRP